MQVQYQNESLRVPDFLIVGAPRAGTTALYTILSSHPQTCMPIEKEPMFFALWGQGPIFEFRKSRQKISWVTETLADYLDLFSSAKEGQVLGEGSTWYLYKHKTVIPNIKKLYGDQFHNLKVIIVLRNPADRAWSQYQAKINEKVEMLDFSAAIRPETIQNRKQNQMTPTYDYIGISHYYDQVRAYLDSFPQVKVFIYEEMFKQDSADVSPVFDFLGLDFEKTRAVPRIVNPSGAPPNTLFSFAMSLVFSKYRLKSILKKPLPPKMRRDIKMWLKAKMLTKTSLDPALKEELSHVFHADILKLERLLDKDLSFWFNGKLNAHVE